MMHNTLSLHYIDRNWKQRGYANNIHLIIDFDNKVYRHIVNFSFPSFHRNILEVKRKSDIDDYIRYLENNDFRKTETEIIRG